MNDSKYSFEFSELELTELVSGLDALQRADKHAGEVCFPLRNRLRAVLFPAVEEVEAAEQAPAIEIALEASEPVESSVSVEPEPVN